MVARSLFSGLVLVLSTLASLGLSPVSVAEAAYPRWSSFAGQQKSPQFRPWSRTDAKPALARRQTQVRAASPHTPGRVSGRRSTTMSIGDQRRRPVFVDQRAGARKAVPITRGQELGLRFRPDERASPYNQADVPRVDTGSGAYSDQLQSQFRPTSRKRKPTYEELQAERAAVPPPIGPAAPYPMLPQPLPPYPGRGPGW